MPVAADFIELTAGNWSPICQYSDYRKSLLICATGNDVLLSTTQNAPQDAGIYLEAGTALAPTIFRLSLAIDDDLVHQEWYAMPVTTPLPVPVSQFFVLPVSTPSANQPITLNVGDLVVVIAANTGTGAIFPTCTSVISGAITPILSYTLNDGLGDRGMLRVFAWVSPGGIDTVTITCGVADTGDAVFYVTTGLTVDVQGTSAGAGAGWSVSTTGPTARPNEVVVVAGINFDSGSAVFPTTAEFNNAFVTASLQGSPSGSTWIMPTAIGIWPAASVARCDLVSNGSQTAAKTAIIAFTTTTPASAASTVSVYQAFDLPPPIDDNRSDFEVRLPRLSPAALTHLADLQARLKEEVHDEQRL